MSLISSSEAPSNTGVAYGMPCLRWAAMATSSSSHSCARSSVRPRALYTLSRNLRSSAALACCCHMSPMPWPMPLPAQRVEHDVGRRAVGHVRHVFDRNDLRDHPLVAMAPGHLVARLQAALDG